MAVRNALSPIVAMLLASPLIDLTGSKHETATLTVLLALVAIEPPLDALSVVPLP